MKKKGKKRIKDIECDEKKKEQNSRGWLWGKENFICVSAVGFRNHYFKRTANPF